MTWTVSSTLGDTFTLVVQLLGYYVMCTNMLEVVRCYLSICLRLHVNEFKFNNAIIFLQKVFFNFMGRGQEPSITPPNYFLRFTIKMRKLPWQQ